jgi:hypothetical protein
MIIDPDQSNLGFNSEFFARYIVRSTSDADFRKLQEMVARGDAVAISPEHPQPDKFKIILQRTSRR